MIEKINTFVSPDLFHDRNRVLAVDKALWWINTIVSWRIHNLTEIEPFFPITDETPGYKFLDSFHFESKELVKAIDESVRMGCIVKPSYNGVTLRVDFYLKGEKKPYRWHVVALGFDGTVRWVQARYVHVSSRPICSNK